MSGPDEFMRSLRARYPGLREAAIADARAALAFRGEDPNFAGGLEALRAVLRLAAISDAFLGQLLYRVKARLQRAGVPVLPRITHRLAIITGQVAIGDPVLMRPGVYVVHGQIVIDGIVEIAEGVVISPFVTIGLRADEYLGPTIEADVRIGTGAKVIGPVRVGRGATIGANAVVVHDVAAGATVVGVPARAIPSSERVG